MTHTPLTTQQLDEIATRLNAATPGPWTSKQELGSPIVHVDQPSPKDGTFSILWTAEWATEADAEFIAHAREDVTALLADNQHLRQQLAELEAYAYGCDAEGCVIPHSSWCEAAKKTAAENDGCTCPQPWKDSPQPHAGYCWLVSPPRAEVEEMRRALAEMRAKTLVEEADLIVAHCPQHGPRDQDGVWMDCHCPVADDMRHRAARPVAASEDTGR